MGVPRHPSKRKVLAIITPSPPYMHPPHPNNVYPQANHQAEQSTVNYFTVKQNALGGQPQPINRSRC
ncbi:hypothetical protein [Oryza sativa Japonica Group]|uniref:Uncharacterized protein n=2 Tax=Oryza sativa subsp. japonica TaxID=39947 RepID=Q5SNK9_ORYSJ|nr:hypothetical protein [Oryza sativa Japonica Group]BAD72422.1 hypothetical protein [Oryza sativa Japonica Group]